MSQINTKSQVQDAHFEAAALKTQQSDLKKQRMNRRIKKVEEQLNKPHVDLDKLKEAVWSGIPAHVP